MSLYFALRSDDEHWQLHHSPCQIQLIENPGERPHLLYTEDRSKNNPSGLKGRKYKPKVFPHYGNTDNPDRCFVCIFKKYRALCPIDRPNNAFYLTPLTKPSDTCWFSCIPLGRNKLLNAVSSMCKLAGIQGFKTNHSLLVWHRWTTCHGMHRSSQHRRNQVIQEIVHRVMGSCIWYFEQCIKEALHYKYRHCTHQAPSTPASATSSTNGSINLPTQLQTSNTDHAGAL